jgi:hypothetical protein
MSQFLWQVGPPCKIHHPPLFLAWFPVGCWQEIRARFIRTLPSLTGLVRINRLASPPHPSRQEQRILAPTVSSRLGERDELVPPSSFLLVGINGSSTGVSKESWRYKEATPTTSLAIGRPMLCRFLAVAQALPRIRPWPWGATSPALSAGR